MEKSTLKLIFTIVLMFSFCTASSKAVQREGNTFKIEKSTGKSSDSEKTPYIWEDSKGMKYPIFMTDSGACYVIKKSQKTGKEYKYYIPKEVRQTINSELKKQTK